MHTWGHEAAFPEVREQPQFNTYTYGLSKREYFAAMAMQGLCASPDATHRKDPVLDIAADAVVIADALIAALNEKEGI